jgi:hypothetical protein
VSRLSAELQDAALRIEGWLLHSGVQLSTGPHRGGVAGWLDARGRAEFVYLEITGYYLTTLAWLAEGSAGSDAGRAPVRERGRAALRWMGAVTAKGALPDNRLYLRPGRDDWRNRAVFSFDLAMAARGVACFGAVLGVEETATLVHRLGDRLAEVCGRSVPLASHALRDGAGGNLPDRWSTRRGPHHAKAAAAMLGLPVGVIDPSLAEACRETVGHWATAMQRTWPCDELHPLLYGVEGLLALSPVMGAQVLDPAEAIYARLLGLQAADGSLPAMRGGSADARSDVLAQALRAGGLLRAAGRLSGADWDARLDALAALLLRHVRPDGGVLFAADQSLANAWCAMFAHQALLLHALADEAAVAARVTRLLV